MAWIKTGNRKSLRVKLRREETYLGIDDYQYFDGVTGQTGTGFTYNSTHWTPLTYGEGGTFAQQPVTGTTGFTARLSAFSGYTRDVLLVGNTPAFEAIDWSKAYELALCPIYLVQDGMTNNVFITTMDPLIPSDPGVTLPQNITYNIRYRVDDAEGPDYNLPLTIVAGLKESTPTEMDYSPANLYWCIEYANNNVVISGTPQLLYELYHRIDAETDLTFCSSTWIDPI